MQYIEKMLKQNNMPEDLKYVAIVESALRPHPRSSKGAIGFWQFIKATGRKYGLKINSDVDERRNIFKSTRAAIKYRVTAFGFFYGFNRARLNCIKKTVCYNALK